MFTYNNLYYFRYTPKTLQKIHVYDMFPMMIPLEIRGISMIGLNMHWIPGPLRVKMINVIIEMNHKSINERLFRLWYRNIKYNPALHFALVAVRRYYLSHCSNIKIIEQDKWESLPFISQSLYKARFMQRSVYNPVQHIKRAGRAITPQIYRKP